MLLSLSASLVIAGALFPRHELYYQALLCLMSSGVLELLELSICFHSRKAFGLSLLNIALLAGIAMSRLLEGFPVIAAKDWHLGVTCLLLYVVDMVLYLRFFHREGHISKRLFLIITFFMASPFLAAATFYGGTKAWIGLSEMLLFGVISVIAIRNISIIKN